MGRAADVADNVKATGGLGRGENRFPCVQKVILKQQRWVALLIMVVAHLLGENINSSPSDSTAYSIAGVALPEMFSTP